MNLENMENIFLSSFVTEIGGTLGGTLSATQALINGAIQDPELRRDLLGGIDRELHHLRFLFENWTLAQMMRTKAPKLVQHSINLSEWLPLYLTNWQKIAPEKNCHWQIHFAENVPEIYIDLDLFARALENLIYASVLCAPPFSKIIIEIVLKDGFVKISLFDSGPLINPLIILDNTVESVKKNFDNHPRLQKGLGLGLIVAYQIVRAHHGEMIFAETEHFASCITINLPV